MFEFIYNQYKRYQRLDLDVWESVGCSDPVEGTPYGSGKHCVKAFRLFVKTHNPQRLFEIGFNNGNSSRILLHLGVPYIASCEVRKSELVTNDSRSVISQWPFRFRFINCASRDFTPEKWEVFDSAYIDGEHDLKSIVNDIELCRSFGITKFLLDDIFPIHGEAMKAAEQCGLTPDWVCGNMMACTDIDKTNLLPLY